MSYNNNLVLTDSVPLRVHHSDVESGWYFQRLTTTTVETIQSLLDQLNLPQEKRKLACTTCQHLITTHDYKIEINGYYHHRFTNPSGITFEIGCFATAPGATRRGMPTLEFTWFSGYAWNLAHCANCLTHLGWFYQASHAENFYGLILANLIET